MKVLFLVATLFAASALGRVSDTGKGCKCPPTVLAMLQGKATVSSGTTGSLASVPCCEKKLTWAGDVSNKHTPGGKCEDRKSCATCTLLDFCVHGKNGCKDINHLEAHEMHEFSHSCDKAPYEPAEITEKDFRDGNMTKPVPFTQKADKSMTEKPVNAFTPPMPGIPANLRAMYSHIPAIAGSGPDWPHEFDGYLGPAYCHHNLEVPPRERPECKGTENDGSQAFIFPQWLHDKHCPCRGQQGCGCSQVQYVAADPEKYPENSLV